MSRERIVNTPAEAEGRVEMQSRGQSLRGRPSQGRRGRGRVGARALGVSFASALVACTRLARPGSRVGPAGPILLVPIAAIWLLAALALASTPPSARIALVLGDSSAACVNPASPDNLVAVSIAVVSSASGRRWSSKRAVARAPSTRLSRRVATVTAPRWRISTGGSSA